jgi:SWI/SNF-related matrix-associated actin-dependent regulator of chromatin subfamily B protein 1
MANQADQLEELVPVRLDIEHDKIKLRDTFTWNLHDRVTHTDNFAEILVEDFKVPPEYVDYITQQVNQKLQEQIQDYYPHVFIEEDPLDPHLPYFAYKNDEMRVLIKLNITIGPHTLVDQFEWEINNHLNNPEQFAMQMTKDLSLSGEFTTAIAHQIREQSQMFTKSLYITGHLFDGRPIEDSDLRDSFLSTPISSVFRPAQSTKEFTPYLYELSEADLQREELSILREQRRQKRSVTRRHGPALPDLKDYERTVRTLLISSVLPGTADSLDNSRLFKLSRTSGRGRRPGIGRTDDLDSDESETEESEIEEIIQITGSTARTRNMRGAATAAQAAMRATIGRSATPEIATLHHHETRTSARRLGFEVREHEESTAEPTTLIVRLKISKDKLRQILSRSKVSRSGEYQQSNQPPTPLIASQTSTPQPSNAAMGASNSSMPPPPSPATHTRSTPTASSVNNTSTPEKQQNGGQQQQWNYYPDGRVDAPFPLLPGQPSVSAQSAQILSPQHV